MRPVLDRQKSVEIGPEEGNVGNMHGGKRQIPDEDWAATVMPFSLPLRAFLGTILTGCQTMTSMRLLRRRVVDGFFRSTSGVGAGPGCRVMRLKIRRSLRKKLRGGIPPPETSLKAKRPCRPARDNLFSIGPRRPPGPIKPIEQSVPCRAHTDKALRHWMSGSHSSSRTSTRRISPRPLAG